MRFLRGDIRYLSKIFLYKYNFIKLFFFSRNLIQVNKNTIIIHCMYNKNIEKGKTRKSVYAVESPLLYYISLSLSLSLRHCAQKGRNSPRLFSHTNRNVGIDLGEILLRKCPSYPPSTPHWNSKPRALSFSHFNFQFVYARALTHAAYIYEEIFLK